MAGLGCVRGVVGKGARKGSWSLIVKGFESHKSAQVLGSEEGST